MKYRHYAPKGELTIVEGTPEEVREYINRAAATDHAAGEKTGIIGTEEMLSGYTAVRTRTASPDIYIPF